VSKNSIASDLGLLSHVNFWSASIIERIFISKEAYGYLLQLSTLGLITPEELEGIIEKAVMRSSPGLGVEEIKLLTAEALFEVRSADSPGEALFPPDTVH